MRRARPSLIPVATALCVLGLALAPGCGSSTGREAEAPDVSAQALDLAAAPEPVPIAEVRRGELRTRVTVSGSVAARRSSPLAPSVSGRIVSVEVEVGDEVAEGDPLFQIEPGPYGLALQRARAGLELARAESAEAQAEASRSQELARKEIASTQQRVRAETRAKIAHARVEQAEAEVEQARSDLDRTVVRAPYTGSIVERSAHEGMMATPATTVVVIQETGELEAVLDVPEASLALIRPGDQVRVFAEGAAEPLRGTVRSVSARIDPASRTYSVRAELEDPENRLRAGAFVRAEIEPRVKTRALLVDRRALISAEGRQFVVRVSGGRSQRVPVRLGMSDTTEIEVLAGLELGDRIVLGDAAARLSDGDAVESVQTEALP
ncbi:MAG: efflux RND transporter periplasmic adaptor subunit [Myxococcales bacterium]|nr:efflux RND transporter periplasmic adaptor subunit [Myxococcales bacterium]